MKFTDIRKIEHLLMEYGMKPGPSTPSSQQTMGSSAKANAATKSPTTSKTAPKPDLGSPTTTPGLEVPKANDQETPKFINAKAGELKTDMEYFDKNGKSAGVVKSPIGKGSKPEAVVVQDPKTKKYSVIDNPDEEVFVANPKFKEGKLDKLSKSSSSNFHFKKNKLQKRIKKLTRKIKMTEQGEPIFEINFNSKEVAQGALNANILCGFEAETVWPNLGAGTDDDDTEWLDNLYWHRVSDIIYDQEGSRSIERVEEAYREWLQEEIVYDFESEVTQELVKDRIEDEEYIDNFISDRIDMSDVEEYKENKLEMLEIDDMQDELEEYSDWDDDAWAREYVEMYEQENFVEWLEEEIRDNGEAWDDAWQRAMDQYDYDDWVRREHGGSWWSLLGDLDIYLWNEDSEGGGVDAVASEVENWASNNSMSNDVRPGAYHSGKGVDNTYWRVEDDTSIEGDGAKAEIISPVYDSPASMLKEIKSLFDFMSNSDVETNSTTGMHVTMSLPNEAGKINKLKIALLLGDQYVLKQFGRNYNSYTRSQENTLKDHVRSLQDDYKNEKSLSALEEIVASGLSDAKFSSINFKSVSNSSGNELVEFRIAGGDDYHADAEKVMKAVIRYAAVMQAGFDKDAYRKDYIKALFKLINNQETISTDAEIKAQQFIDPDSIDDTVLGVFKSLSSEKHYTDAIEALNNAYVTLRSAHSTRDSEPQQELQFEDEESADWRRQEIKAQKYFVRAFAMLASDLASGANREKIRAAQIAPLRRAVKEFGLSVKQLWAELQQSEYYKNFPGDVHNKSEKFATAVNTLLKKQDAKAKQPEYSISVPKGHFMLLPAEKHQQIFKDIFSDNRELDPNATVSKDDFLAVSKNEWDTVRGARHEIEANQQDVDREKELIKQMKADPGYDEQLRQTAVKQREDKIAEWEAENAQHKQTVDAFVKKYGFAPKSVKYGSEPIGPEYIPVLAPHRTELSDRFNIKFNVQERVMDTFDNLDTLPVLEQLALLSKIDKKKIDEAWNKKNKKNETVEAEQDMTALLTAYGTPKKKKKKTKTNEEAVNDFNRVEIVNGLMADHFPVSDLKKQMLAYQAIPIPEMLDAFHDLRAQAGDDACARGIVKYFSNALPEEIQTQLKLNEWSSSHVKSILAEAKGLMGRVVGDQFKKGDSTLEFSSVEVYPQDRAQFDDAPERESFVSDIEQQLNAQIEWTNTPNSGSLAFGIAILTDPSNNDKPVYWGRYFKQKRVDMMGAWANNQVPTGWKLQKAGALKLDLGIDPQHLIKNENVYNGIDEVISTVAKNSQGHEIQQELLNGLTSIKNKEHPVFEGQIKNLPALRDYFGEIMGPVALMAGMVGGQAEDARQDLMGGAEWSTFGVFWPQAMNYALVDSVFIGPDGTEVGISSKGGKGGKASAKNIADAIDKAPPELVKAHAYTVKILKIVQESSAIDGPFRLAELLGVLPKKLELEIMGYVKAGKTDYNGLSKSAKELFNYGTPKQDIPGFNVGYALIALLAKKVAAMINEESQFSAGAIAFLNQSSIVQLYCKMGKQGDNARVTGWEALYPPNFRGKILLDGAKNYYSSRIGGKFAFEFKPDA